MTTKQSELLCKCLDATAGALMEDNNVRHNVKVLMQESLFQLKRELGVIKVVDCPAYTPTKDEVERMENNGES